MARRRHVSGVYSGLKLLWRVLASVRRSASPAPSLHCNTEVS
ncbi:hypothetical protein SS05631_c39170 [Sinorhizobium sp. CCBAU 05631]|nr:hypothetical protein SS05631_c39170 [Sinorhizobium sp. CCBAU 05631]